MNKELKEYKQFVENNIKYFNEELQGKNDKPKMELLHKKVSELATYHSRKIHDYQHERLIHLIVTFFFAGLLLIAIAASFLFSSLVGSDSNIIITNLSLCISLILLVTELFYIKHYYFLENNTQALYKYSEILYKIQSTAINH